jgi:hypothetical protein
MPRRATTGWSTLTLFTIVGLGMVLALVGARPYRWRRLLFVLPIVTAMLMTMAVAPTGMRLAGLRASAGAFALTVVLVTFLQILLTSVLAPLAGQATWRMLSNDPAAAWGVSVHETPRLIARVTSSIGGAAVLEGELSRRASLVAIPALLGVVGWQLGTLFGARWVRVTAAWCALSFQVVFTGPLSSRSHWWLTILWLSVLAVGLTAAARFAPSRADHQITR